MKVFCFFHRADLDGHCCGAIVRRWCGINGHEFVPRGVNYGDRVDWYEGAGPESIAVIADFTPEGPHPEDTLDIMHSAYAGGAVWIDHHATAIGRVRRDPQAHPLDVAGMQEVGTAACELAWRYFFPAETAPRAVRLLGLYDVFDRSDAPAWEHQILPFQYGIRMRKTLPDGGDERNLWDLLLHPGNLWKHLVDNIIDEGKFALAYEREQNRKTAKAAYDCEFEGMPCCAVNARGNSLVLDAYARPEHRMRILWGFTGGRWRVSLFENGHDDVDCGALAARHGGGGHKGAAGFELPPDLCPLVYFTPQKTDGTNAGNSTGVGA